MLAVETARLCLVCHEPLLGDIRPDAKTHRGSCRDAYKREQHDLRHGDVPRDRIRAFWARYGTLRAGRKGRTAEAARAVRDRPYEPDPAGVVA